MMDRQRLFTQLKLHEGVEQKAYLCSAGYITIGVGRNLEDRGLSDAEIEFLLDNDVIIVENELTKAFPWWKDMSEIRQRVLADMAFNMGVPRLKGFKNALAAMKEGDYAEAADEMMDSIWAKQVGTRAARLAHMMEHDTDSTDF